MTDVSAAPAHRRHPPRPAIALVALAAIGVIVWWAVETWRAAQPAGPLTASGTIEADEVLLAAEVAGRLTAIVVAEGQTIDRGAVVARLDDSLIQTQVRQADPATRRQLEIQLDRYTMRSPIGGVVTRVPARAGEVVAPGQAIAAVADLTRLSLTVYVLERDLGRVAVGRPVAVAADPFPGRSFRGFVTSIANRAEFTPRNVQTRRDRENLVFGVKVAVDNPDAALKPGLPVDATFEAS